MKDKKKALDLVKRAMQNVDSTVVNVEYAHTITGYFGFTELDVADYISYIENELGVEITDKDIESRMSTTVGEAVKFLTELTIDKNE